MADKLAIMLELDKRGKLPAGKKKLLDEARKRGLVDDGTVHDDDLKAMQAPEQPADPMGHDAVTSLVSEGMSGVNEGLSNTATLGSDIVRTALSAGPAVVNAFGGHAAMPDYVPDLGAPIKEGMEKTGMIRPPVDDMPHRFVRRIGQEVGASALPGLGFASKAAAPARVLGGELVSALGSGTGAATAEEVAPGNSSAELAGQLIGGFSPVAIGASVRRGAMEKAAPTVEQLKDNAGDLYDKARASGVKSTKPMNQMVSADMKTIAQDEGLISPTGRVSGAYPKLKDVLDTFDDYANGEMNVKQMQTVRRTLTDAAASSEPGERRIANRMLESFDAHTAQLAPELSEANAIYHRAKKGELIDTAIELAGSRAGQFSGSGFENALRTEFRGLERQIIKGQLRGISGDEEAAIRKVAQGGGFENVARWIGKFAPSGNVSTVGGALAGNALGGPVGAGLVLGGGAVGRHVATKLTMGNADKASAIMRRGPIVLGAPLTGDEGRALGSTAIGEVVNDRASRPTTKTMTLSEWATGGAGASSP